TVERRRADPVLAAHLGGRKPGLLLAQHRNDLLFREPRSLHRPVLPSGRTLASSGGNNGGHSSHCFDDRENVFMLRRTRTLRCEDSGSCCGNRKARGLGGPWSRAKGFGFSKR